MMETKTVYIEVQTEADAATILDIAYQLAEQLVVELESYGEEATVEDKGVGVWDVPVTMKAKGGE